MAPTSPDRKGAPLGPAHLGSYFGQPLVAESDGGGYARARASANQLAKIRACVGQTDAIPISRRLRLSIESTSQRLRSDFGQRLIDRLGLVRLPLATGLHWTLLDANPASDPRGQRGQAKPRRAPSGPLASLLEAGLAAILEAEISAIREAIYGPSKDATGSVADQPLGQV